MESKEEIIEYIEDHTDEEVVIFDNYASAFIGLSDDYRAVYDFELMVEYLEDEETSRVEAIEWIEYNTIRSLPYYGDKAPIILFPLEV